MIRHPNDVSSKLNGGIYFGSSGPYSSPEIQEMALQYHKKVEVQSKTTPELRRALAEILTYVPEGLARQGGEFGNSYARLRRGVAHEQQPVNLHDVDLITAELARQGTRVPSQIIMGLKKIIEDLEESTQPTEQKG